MPSIKVSGGSLARASTVADAFVMIYEVPLTVSGCTASVHVTNTNATEALVWIAITSNSAGSLVAADYIMYSMTVNANGLAGLSCGPLSPGEKVYIKSNVVGVGVQLRGFLQNSTGGTSGGLLGSANSVANTYNTVYEVPVTLAGATGSLQIVNTNAAEAIVWVAVTTNPSSSLTAGDFIMYGVTVPGHGLAGVSCGPLSPGEKVYLKSNVVGVGAQLRGYTQSST